MQKSSTAWSRLASQILTVDQIREVDRVAIEQYQMSSLVLMENAALGCVDWLRRQFTGTPSTVILCGRGNNGGDGLAIARHLRVHGWRCCVAVLGPVDRMSSDARSNLRILQTGGDCEVLLWDANPNDQLMMQLGERIHSADVILDAMLGTGATGEPKAPLSDWIRIANQSRAARIAIDVPTGWNATTGQPSAVTFHCSATLTFVARKPAMANAQSHRYLGEVFVIPIGIPALQIERLLASLDATHSNSDTPEPPR